jgi:Zn-dependent protease/CBS domain-containing protein
MFQKGIRLFTIRGIDVRLDYSWFIIFVLITWSLAQYQFDKLPAHISWGLGAVTSILFFISVLLHELAHSMVARARDIPVPRITLFIFGGASEMAQEPKEARDEFLMALAGPATSVGIFLVMGVLAILSHNLLEQGPFDPGKFTKGDVHPLVSVFGWLSLINLMLALFNMIPGFPLDGGRVFRSIIWGITGNASMATQIAANTGRLVAYGFIFIGIYLLMKGPFINGLWLALIGWFVLQAASQSARRQELHDLLSGYTAGEVMWTDFPAVGAYTPVSDLVERYIFHTGRRCFPVTEDHSVTGIITLHNVKSLEREKWPDTPVRDIMIPLNSLKSVSPETPLPQVMDMMTPDGYNQVPVVENGVFKGMISRESLMEFLKKRKDLGLEKTGRLPDNI